MSKSDGIKVPFNAPLNESDTEQQTNCTSAPLSLISADEPES